MESELKHRAVRTIILLAALLHLSWAYSMYRDRIPNGANVPHPCKPNYLWRGVGHVNPLGGGSKNIFGADFKRFGSTWNEDLCRHDSDGDGLTNGQELGDPNCVWREGDLPARTTNITHPGVCDPWEHSVCKTYNSWIDCNLADFHCPTLDNDPEIMNITLQFPPTAVPNQETSYICMTFDLPGDDVYDIVADEPLIDNAQVMHHMLMFSCQAARTLPEISSPIPCGMATVSGCNEIVGGWTVGSPGYCRPQSVGIRFGQGLFTRVVLQVHWNNPELRSDYTDSSGLIVHYTRRLRPYGATTLTVGQRELRIPPRQPSVEITGSCPSECSRLLFSQPLYVIEGLNHMHYLGKSQKIELFRNNRLVTTITNDEVYSYDSPVRVVHDPPIQVLPGDEMKVTCEYNSKNKNETIYYGDGTNDEMCFGFLTVYPKEALPHTQWCVAYGEESVCDRFMENNENQDGDDSSGGDSAEEPEIEGCQWRKFANTNSSEFQGVLSRLSHGCDAFGECQPKCAEVMRSWARHPCLHGNAWEMVKRELVQSYDGLRMTAYISSCPLVFCPLCPTCN